MINDILVFDNIIDRSYQDLIEDTLLSNSFPWYYVKSVSYGGERESTNDNFGFSHVFTSQGVSNSQTLNLLLPLAHQACGKINFKMNGIIYARSFLLFPNANVDLTNLFHVDMNDPPHLVLLYYVNDSDGPTVISKHTIHDYSASQINALNNKDIIKVVEPKKGRCILFDGKFYHAGSNPTKNKRCAINFNIV